MPLKYKELQSISKNTIYLSLLKSIFEIFISGIRMASTPRSYLPAFRKDQKFLVSPKEEITGITAAKTETFGGEDLFSL